MSQKPSVKPQSTPPKAAKQYTPEFKEKAVKLVTELGYSTSQVAEKLGCSQISVQRWVKATKPKLDPETILRMELEENETKRLRNEIERLKTENEILKKATAYFARQTM